MPDIESTTRSPWRALEVDARLVESIALTVLGAATAFVLSPNDPVVLHSGFPWIAFIPLFIGLLHGFVAALGSLVVLGLWAMALAYVDASVLITSLDARLGLGIVLVALLPAEVRDRFARENQGLRARIATADERIEGLTRSHSLLLASHRNLERAAISDERSLVANFERMREQLRRYAGPMSIVLRGAQDILSLFAAHGLVQSAAILHYEHGKVGRRAIASIGEPTVDPDHPLVEAAIVGRCVATVRELDPLASGVADTSVLAVVPLVDAHKRVWGVVVIYEMPFIALRDDYLRVLLSIGSSLADVFAAASEPATVQQSVVGVPAQRPALAIALASNECAEGQEASHGHAR